MVRTDKRTDDNLDRIKGMRKLSKSSIVAGAVELYSTMDRLHINVPTEFSFYAYISNKLGTIIIDFRMAELYREAISKAISSEEKYIISSGFEITIKNLQAKECLIGSLYKSNKIPSKIQDKANDILNCVKLFCSSTGENVDKYKILEGSLERVEREADWICGFDKIEIVSSAKSAKI